MEEQVQMNEKLRALLEKAKRENIQTAGAELSECYHLRDRKSREASGKTPSQWEKPAIPTRKASSGYGAGENSATRNPEKSARTAGGSDRPGA